MKIKVIIDKLKSVPTIWWGLLLLIVVGIFLRSYNHHDWLRFNADQGRDAEIVSNVVDGTAPLPLLGPKAGGTEFKLGPVFYYFEIVSAKIFGDTPDKMAYPDLFTGILCIPLLYFFLRKYFDQKIALAMSAIFAVSNYSVRYARFAWNPNSTPFWTILALFAIHEVISEKNKRKFLWSAIAGIAIGVGVQLHTTLLLFLPITTIIVFGYLAFKNKTILKYFFVILAMALFLNVPQLTNEYQNKGENIKAFFGGLKTKQSKENSKLDNILRDSSCWIQGNVDIISGYEISDTCAFKPAKNKDDLAVFVIGVIFVLGGTILGVRYLKKETDYDKKVFLGLTLLFTAVAYLIFFKIASELSMRFYLVLIFLPFLLLGFWMQFFKEKFPRKCAMISLLLTVLLVCSNLFYVFKSFKQLADYAKKGGTVEVTTLKEAEEFSHFIVANSDETKEVFIDGNEKFLFKAFKPIKYLVSRSRIDISLIGKKNALPDRYFYVARSAKKEKLLQDPSIKIVQYKTYGKFTMLLIAK